jgi:transposase-like protein
MVERRAPCAGCRPGSLGTGHRLSAATITRLSEQWKHDPTKFGRRSLKDVDYVYLWVDGALGFWKALRDVFPETAEQRCS